MIDEVGERMPDAASFGWLVLGLVSASSELERLVSQDGRSGARRFGARDGDRGPEGRGQAGHAGAEDPCLLAVLGAIGLAHRLRELLARVESKERDVPAPPAADAAPGPERGSLLR